MQTDFHLPKEQCQAVLAKLQQLGLCAVASVPTNNVCIDIATCPSPSGHPWLAFWTENAHEPFRRFSLHWLSDQERVALTVQEVMLHHGATIVFGEVKPKKRWFVWARKKPKSGDEPAQRTTGV